MMLSHERSSIHFCRRFRRDRNFAEKLCEANPKNFPTPMFHTPAEGRRWPNFVIRMRMFHATDFRARIQQKSTLFIWLYCAICVSECVCACVCQTNRKWEKRTLNTNRIYADGNTVFSTALDEISWILEVLLYYVG